jgi:choline kinase
MTSAVILAAGRGSRLGHLTERKPKCLMEFNNVSLLQRQISSLKSGGIHAIAVVTGYLAGLVEKACRLPVFHNSEWESTGIFHSMLAATAWLEAGPVIISYGDIFYSAETVRRLAAARGDIVLAFDPNWWSLWSARSLDPLSDAESFKVEADGRIVDIGRQISDRLEASGQYMGLLKLTPRGFANLTSSANHTRSSHRRLDMTGALRAAIAAGHEVRGVERQGAWGEVDTPADLDLYERMGIP